MTRPGLLAAAGRRAGYGLNGALFLAALVTIAVVVNYFAHRPGLRLGADATKTRAYSLSGQTRQLLAGLEGEWTIALIMVENATDDATRQQVDQILARYEAASDHVRVVRVDPVDPRSFEAYESLLARLRELEADRIAAYDVALDDGVRTFEDLRLLAQQQAGQLGELLQTIDASDPLHREVQQLVGLLGLLPQEGGKVLDAVDAARQVTDAQPVPDYETARSVLALTLSRYANEFYEIAQLYGDWRRRDDVPPAVAEYAGAAAEAYERNARHLAAVADPLAQLPVLEISSIGRQLQGGEALLIIGPDRSAVIPSAQLFPTMNVRQVGDGAVAFDRRFRGEQVISAAIRSLLLPQMPMVVFVHAESSSVLRPEPQRVDLAALGAVLQASRFVVAEWSVATAGRPAVPPETPVAWVVVPPLRRQGPEPDAAEKALIRATAGLIAEGASVMLTVNPSLLPRYRQPDPWQSVARPFNLRPDTAHVIYEAPPVSDHGTGYQRAQALHRYGGEHVICAAANGQLTLFGLPVPIEIADPERRDVAHTVIAEVEPGGRRWLEPEWDRKILVDGEVQRGAPLEKAAPIMIAAERPDPAGGGTQRFILAGSVEWMRSFVTDAVTPIGGGRAALEHPGNQELFLAATAWLAGMDELIAPGPVSQQVARLSGIDRRVATLWALITVLGAPLAVLLAGVGVWLVRR